MAEQSGKGSSTLWLGRWELSRLCVCVCVRVCVHTKEGRRGYSLCTLFGLVEALFGLGQALFGLVEALFGLVEALFGLVQTLFGLVEALFGLVEALFGLVQTLFGLVQTLFGLVLATSLLVLYFFLEVSLWIKGWYSMSMSLGSGDHQIHMIAVSFKFFVLLWAIVGERMFIHWCSIEPHTCFVCSNATFHPIEEFHFCVSLFCVDIAFSTWVQSKQSVTVFLYCMLRKCLMSWAALV